MWIEFDFDFHLQNTQMLRAIPGLNQLGKALLGIEHMLFTIELLQIVDNLSFKLFLLFWLIVELLLLQFEFC